MAWRGSVKIRAKNVLLGNSGKAAALLALSVGISLLLSGAAAAIAYGMRLSPVYAPLHSVSGGIVFPIVMMVLAALMLVGSILVLAPLALGREAWFWQRSRREFVKTGYVWSWYRKLTPATGLWLRKKLLVLGWSAVFLGPGAGLLALFGWLLWRGSTPAVLLILGIGGTALLLCGLLFLLLMLQRYLMAPYLIADNPRMSASAALRESTSLMDGMLWRTLRFKWSFWPWFLLCLLIFPCFYVWPYYKQACACYGQYIYSSRRAPLRGKIMPAQA